MTWVAGPRAGRQNGAMPGIQIKGVPAETHAELRRRAAAAHQSLQEYLLAHLIDHAARPDLGAVLDRVEARSGGRVTFAEAAGLVRDDRDRR